MQLAAHLLRWLGLYPPGTLARLTTARPPLHPGRRKALREVGSLLECRGRSRKRPQVRNLSRSAIVGLPEIDPRWLDIRWEQYWGYWAVRPAARRSSTRAAARRPKVAVTQTDEP